MGECIFCEIIKGEIPCEKIYEDERILSFRDLNPEAPVHVLIIPKKHIGSLNEIEEEDSAIMGDIVTAARKIALKLGVAENGYRLVTNCGDHGGQTVAHIHFHLLGGRKLNWPPG